MAKVKNIKKVLNAVESAQSCKTDAFGNQICGLTKTKVIPEGGGTECITDAITGDKYCGLEIPGGKVLPDPEPLPAPEPVYPIGGGLPSIDPMPMEPIQERPIVPAYSIDPDPEPEPQPEPVYNYVPVTDPMPGDVLYEPQTPVILPPAPPEEEIEQVSQIDLPDAVNIVEPEEELNADTVTNAPTSNASQTTNIYPTAVPSGSGSSGGGGGDEDESKNRLVYLFWVVFGITATVAALTFDKERKLV